MNKTHGGLMTPSQQCKHYGLDSLQELAILTGQSVQTLINWSKSKPEFFRIVIFGSIAKKLKVFNEIDHHNNTLGCEPDR